MRKDSPRYHEISASQFAHERAGLDQLRELVPDRAPFQVWTNFEFRDSQGKWHEVDALVLGERRLHLVELKHYQGQISGNSYRWQRGRFSEDNPLILARRKAQRLASVIKDRLRELDPTGAAGPVPFIQESVYLHADNFRVVMADADLRDLFGPDDKTRATNLPSLAERLLEPVNAQSNKLIANDDLLVALFEKIGFGMRREREVGSWRLIEQIAEGAGWQDWAAEHKLMHARRARIRFFVTPPGAADSERARINALAKREYEVTTRLHHDGVARPEDIVEDELGLGLVYHRGENEQRLDLWLADNSTSLSLDDRVKLVRQLAETVKYVHQRHLVHRALSPAAVTVTGKPDEPRLSIGDWQFAGDSAVDSAKSRGTATRLFAAADAAQTHSSGSNPAGAYLAPEARWVSDADRVRLDVFALGALSYLIFAGTSPAADATELRARVQNDQGLNLAADVPELPQGLRSMVLAATTPMVSDRTPDADAFLAAIDAAVTESPTTQEPNDDLDAPPGTLIAGRYKIKRRLGSGSTAVGLLVLDTQNDDEACVLKVALNDRANQRLADEAEVLRSVTRANSTRLIRLMDGPLQVGTRQLCCSSPPASRPSRTPSSHAVGSPLTCSNDGAPT